MGDVEIREGLGGSRHISARASADPSRIDGLRVMTSSCSSDTSFSSCGREYTIMMLSRSPRRVTLCERMGRCGLILTTRRTNESEGLGLFEERRKHRDGI